MNNLIFFICLIVVSYIIAKGFMLLDTWLNSKLQPTTDTLSDNNWFLKYELYRKGVTGNAEKKRGL